jgi:hypothetical protein
MPEEYFHRAASEITRSGQTPSHLVIIHWPEGNGGIDTKEKRRKVTCGAATSAERN